jgi:hypothetical protein
MSEIDGNVGTLALDDIEQGHLEILLKESVWFGEHHTELIAGYGDDTWVAISNGVVLDWDYTHDGVLMKCYRDYPDYIAVIFPLSQGMQKTRGGYLQRATIYSPHSIFGAEETPVPIEAGTPHNSFKREEPY